MCSVCVKMKERLQKIISACGVCSRRSAEKYIEAGRVTVNGNIAKLGDSADLELDTVLLDGKPLKKTEQFVYIMLNKPRGVITTMCDDKGRKTVAELVADCPVRVYPVGRLDYDSEGLLIMTNDGALANTLMHPSFEKDKIYRVTVKGDVSTGAALLERVDSVDGKRIGRAKIKLVSSSKDRGVLDITIHEGRNRQVRKMCAACGLEVCRLVRVFQAGLALDALPSGKWRYLTEAEQKMIAVRKCKSKKMQ